MQAPVVDRLGFEQLFGVRRRRAIQLMSFFGGFQAGKTFLVDRLDLMRQLEPIEASAEFALEQRRRKKLVEALEDARRYRAAARAIIPVQPLNGNAHDLPAGVWLHPNCLRVEFQDAEDLLSKLYALAQTAAQDFDAFRMAVDPASGVLSLSSPATTSPTTPRAGTVACWSPTTTGSSAAATPKTTTLTATASASS